MIHKIGIMNGAMFMQGFVDRDTIRFYDPGFRFPGGEYEKTLLFATGVNLMKYAISYALGLTIPVERSINNCYQLAGKRAIQLFFTARPGTIAIYEGLDEIKKIHGVITVAPKAYVGSVIPDSGDVKQRVAEIGIIVNDQKNEIESVVREIQSRFKVLDSDGNNMLVSMVNPSMFT